MVDIRESLWVQRWINEGVEVGRIQNLREILLRLGRNRFGEPLADEVARIVETTDLAKLQAWFDRALRVETWGELFAETA